MFPKEQIVAHLEAASPPEEPTYRNEFRHELGEAGKSSTLIGKGLEDTERMDR